ncbi:T9SS type A sorting domain-containing protein [Aestuariibaculum suncheonense]|uniref:T9SS type A sorting domain-containing protein n=1 Tax=Aestuariibaculum suncheonense TaxID=1028745 RepID=A0A8J6UA79_9FLAO|nr:T9SS type A sorting domain-containing protein [Aestuariibaculum suncheonense]MBD0834928.1 T9SS type A sorting domain-containing protein [Aestuariibaculum suncheonense]
MKQIYFLCLAAFLGFNMAYAEPCPAGGGTLINGTVIVFYYPDGTSFCNSRPQTIQVKDNTTEVISTFTLGSCTENISNYNLNTGDSPLSGAGFEVTTGFDTTCSYSNGTLPVEAFVELSKDLKIYPSPVFGGNEIQLTFGLNTTAKIEVFNITGKMVLRDSVADRTSKSINIGSLVNGLYMVKIATDYGSITRKIVISK